MDMTYEDFLEHYGTKGQKWGVRKYQNPDGSLTAAGRVHYGVGKARDAAVTAVKKVAKATGNVAKKVAVATGHGVAKAGSATAHKVGEIHDKRKAKKREQKIREWATDLEELNKHQTELTDDEYREALSRANMNRQLSDLKKAELDRGLSYIKSAAEATGNTLTLANNVSKMITGKSFEDLRKPETEMDKLKLAKERLINESQAAITATNQSKQREQENKENAAKAKSEFDLRRMRETTEADRWKEKDAAEVAKREYQQHKEQRAAIDEAMRQVKEHDAQVAASRKAAAEKAAETRAANEYRKEMRATPEYKTIFNRLDKAYTNTMEDYYQKQGDSAAEAKKKAKEYVERLADKWLDDDLALSAFDDPNYLEHHGVKGQRWGVRRYQNLDGSLTEEGKVHRLRYISKETEKNNAYYSKYEKKYQKLADKAKSDEERAQYLAMKADATKSKNQVNEYLKNMSFDQILANEKESRDKAIKTASTVAKVGLMGISMAGGVAGVAAGVRAGVAGASMAVNFLSNPDNQAMLVNNAMKYAEMGIRAVVDVKQWATGVAIDEMASNIGKYTNPDDFRVVGEAAGKIVRSVSEGFASTSGDAVSRATEKVTEAAISGATRAVESHGGDAGSAALKVAAELARETATTSGAISGDVATTAQNVNDIVNLVTAAGRVKHSADQDPNFLAHHGIKGQKWGVRRFQNPDGTLTEAGLKRRYGRRFLESNAHYKARLRKDPEIKKQAEIVGDKKREADKRGWQMMAAYYESNQNMNSKASMQKKVDDAADAYAEAYHDYTNSVQEALKNTRISELSIDAAATAQRVLFDMGDEIAKAYEASDGRVERKNKSAKEMHEQSDNGNLHNDFKRHLGWAGVDGFKNPKYAEAQKAADSAWDAVSKAEATANALEDNGKEHTPEYKKAISAYTKAKREAEIASDKVEKIALDVLGYEDNVETRRIIQNEVYWR